MHIKWIQDTNEYRIRMNSGVSKMEGELKAGMLEPSSTSPYCRVCQESLPKVEEALCLYGKAGSMSTNSRHRVNDVRSLRWREMRNNKQDYLVRNIKLYFLFVKLFCLKNGGRADWRLRVQTLMLNKVRKLACSNNLARKETIFTPWHWRRIFFVFLTRAQLHITVCRYTHFKFNPESIRQFLWYRGKIYCNLFFLFSQKIVQTVVKKNWLSLTEPG